MVYEEDDTTGLWDWIGQTLDTPSFLKTRLTFGIVVGVAATMLFTHILFQMERHNATYKAAAMEAAVGERDTQLELEDEDDHLKSSTPNGEYVQAGNDSASLPAKARATNGTEPDSMYKPGDSRRRLSGIQKTQIIANVVVLILFNYLLLVFKPGSVALSFFAMVVIWVMSLHSYLRDELRRSRYDRFVAMVALFFVLAGCLTLITYCRLALKEGSIYQGPARIVGYDDTVYTNKDGETMRADLTVSWGGSWGCPDEGGSFCRADVQGALCETKYNTTTTRRKRRRSRRTETVVEKVEDYEAEQDREEAEKDVPTDDKEAEIETVKAEAAEEVEEAEEEADEEIEEVVNEADVVIAEVEEEDNEEIDELSAEIDQDAEQVEVSEQEITALEGKGNATTAQIEDNLVKEVDSEAEKVAEVEAKNDELAEELEEEEEVDEELEDEVEELEEDYSYDDEVIEEDDYWDQDWDTVWGEYACEDLFDSDLDGELPDSSTPPGKDSWPTVMIYGSCNSCKAFVQDYYSTEHFQDINSYEYQSWLYLMMGFGLLVLAAVAAVVERVRPTKENKVVLLSYDEGVQA